MLCNGFDCVLIAEKLSGRITDKVFELIRTDRLCSASFSLEMVSATKKAEESSAVLTNDIDEKATVVTAYVAGRFNRAALICAEGDSVEAHEEELRKAGIHLTVKL